MAVLVGLVVVLVGRDPLAHVIGFAVQLALILLRQMAVVLRHVSFFIVLQALLAMLQAARFPGRELAALHTVGNPLLLVCLPMIDLVDARMPRIDLACTGSGRVGILGSGGPHRHETTHCKN